VKDPPKCAPYTEKGICPNRLECKFYHRSPVEVCIKWGIHDFWQIDTFVLTSQPFVVDGVEWQLLLYPFGRDESGQMELYLVMLRLTRGPGWAVRARVQVMLGTVDMKAQKDYTFNANSKAFLFLLWQGFPSTQCQSLPHLEIAFRFFNRDKVKHRIQVLGLDRVPIDQVRPLFAAQLPYRSCKFIEKQGLVIRFNTEKEAKDAIQYWHCKSIAGKRIKVGPYCQPFTRILSEEDVFRVHPEDAPVLPYEILRHIMGYCCPKGLSLFTQTCTRAKKFSTEEIIWRNIFTRAFGPVIESPTVPILWFDQFKRFSLIFRSIRRRCLLEFEWEAKNGSEEDRHCCWYCKWSKENWKVGARQTSMSLDALWLLFKPQSSH